MMFTYSSGKVGYKMYNQGEVTNTEEDFNYRFGHSLELAAFSNFLNACTNGEYAFVNLSYEGEGNGTVFDCFNIEGVGNDLKENKFNGNGVSLYYDKGIISDDEFKVMYVIKDDEKDKTSLKKEMEEKMEPIFKEHLSLYKRETCVLQ